jgi:glycosyltransferase involved in cell wall biosynthesis
LGIAEHTFFTGRCDNVNEVLAISDVCVLSSIAEGFPNAILEYMGAGRPVVATEVGGTPEAVRDGETGFLVPARNPEAMAQRIVELLNNPARAKEMGANGRRVAEQEFSCEAQLKKTESLYERLLSLDHGNVVEHSGKLHTERV